MHTYQILSRTLTSTDRHTHLTDVETDAGTSHPDRRWTVAQVRQALAAGDTFFTSSSRRTAFIHASMCPCGFDTISSDCDAAAEVDVDHLRTSLTRSNRSGGARSRRFGSLFRVAM